MPKRPFALLSQGGTPDSSCTQSYRYDVFISFRGLDTRNTFVDHLYAHLTRKGIFAFKDDTRLQKGESISPQLLQAIKNSWVSMVVFSKDYASSTWCLDEMATIAECHTEFKQTVFPVFYDVDPSHVRRQNGVYKSAFDLHAEQFKDYPSKVARWKSAMTSLAGSAGWDVRNKPEVVEIENIVQAVIKRLGHRFSGFSDYLIGIQPHIEALESHLKLSSEDDGFRVLGIWGMDGIGKTTLATVLYDRISYQFDACCFIENVSKIYRDGSATAVQKQIIRQTIEEKNLEACSPYEISAIVTKRLHNMKLLIVLDNVDQYEQLDELHIKPELLCARSRIIIITRDVHILRQYGVDMVYEAQLMNDNDARELLCRKAFKSSYSSSTCAKLIPEVLKYARGLPLAIKVIGSFLCTRNAMQWRATLDELQDNQPDRIMKVLQTSFDGLKPGEREIFLHIACFFEGEREDYVRQVLEACGLHPDIRIPCLAEKSLIMIRNEEIHMHEMLQELGKEIVRREHPDEPRLWSRLWLYRDFHRMMMTEMRGREVKAIVLDQKEDDFKFSKLRAEDLSKLKHLRLLILYHKNFSGRPVFLSDALCYLSWNGYPFTSLPLNFQPYDLVELNLPNSSIEQLWKDIQLPSLKRMDLSNSKNFKMTPCFEGIQNLERLDLTGCINLSQVDPSIGLLTGLVFLSLQNCRSLIRLDFGNVSRLISLRVLRLSGCTKFESCPDFIGALNLEYLEMDGCTSLSTIHESIGALERIRFLSLRDCTNLVVMPDSFEKMASLITLDLRGCLKFTNFPLRRIFDYPSPLQSLIFLDVSFCNIFDVPDAIVELRCLERLNLQGNNFSTLPTTIERLYSLAYLNFSHCHHFHGTFLALPTESAPSESVGKYFKTTSGSRDHRSGLYAFDYHCIMEVSDLAHIEWVQRLLQEPRHFRCGFDIVLPRQRESRCSPIPQWFDKDHRFDRGSIIRITHSNMHVDWVGFVFCVAFTVENRSAISSSPLPHPFYLSFETEHAEERFDMPLSLERHKVDGSDYIWTIYISREHCHFVETGARITFKACQGLIVEEWGLRVLTKQVEENYNGISFERTHLPLVEVIDNGEESSGSIEGKIQLPYNWLVSDEDKDENDDAKRKETNLCNLGLLPGRP